ncbi:MAG: hypothetical protein LBS60_00560 [Deltaproteobacteria bacterium]|nr:hypothetical protein [Deltaproteobacteria bacterium]
MIKTDKLDNHFSACKNIFDANNNIDQYNESKIQEKVIKPILLNLGWVYEVEEIKIVSGLERKIDAILFSDKTKRDNYINLSKSDRQSSWTGIDAILESKAATDALDTKKISQDANPYIQTLVNLRSAKINRGFLTNGRQWYFVDNSLVSSEKRYVIFYLDKILEDDKKKEFDFFFRLFNAQNYRTDSLERLSPLERLDELDQTLRRKMEDDLRAVIYGEVGEYSLFEEIGRAIYLSAEQKDLKDIFENSLFLLFRLIIIAYFEDRHQDYLSPRQGYGSVSLRKIRERLRPNSKRCIGWKKLQKLFTILDKGDLSLHIYNLGTDLFDQTKTPLLNNPTIFSDQILSTIFNKLFTFKDHDKDFERDFSPLSPAQLGTIYEGLLEFEFRVAKENQTYAIIQSPKEKGEGFYDVHDLNTLKSQKNTKITVIKEYNKGDFYIINRNQNRKVSGSYYTPLSLAVPLVTSGLKRLLDGPFKERSVLDLRILDCSCGSGHLLVVALNILTNMTLERLATAAETNLRELLDIEINSIFSNYQSMDLRPEAMAFDELMVLKRLLLKKTIYGVDLSPFAAELARLSLWLDTFIFGAPLSFIERNIKSGNSLLGNDIESLSQEAFFYDNNNSINGAKNAFFTKIFDSFQFMRDEIVSVNYLNDTTNEDIVKSKQIYNNEILPKITELNNYFNFSNYLDILRVKKVYPLPPIFSWFNPERNPQVLPDYENEIKKYKVEIDNCQQEFNFFNWEVEFPEIFSTHNFNGPGFHLIVGNPPWDKTKFEEPLFFSQYKFNYRTLDNRKKKEIAADILAIPEIRDKYDQAKDRALVINEHLKVKYPHNAGAGDGNLFRFFVEKALSLLANGGVLNYVLPTGLLTEDGSIALRKHIFKNFRINSFDGFENRLGIFPDVDSRYKFGLIQIENTVDDQQKAMTRFALTDPKVLDTAERKFEYRLDDIKLTSPRHWAYLEIADGKKDLEILIKLYSKFPALKPEWLDFRNELHATNDKSVFKKEFKSSALKPEWLDFRRELDATNDKSIFKKEFKIGYIPLYKGEMIWQFEAQASQPEYWLDPVELDDYLGERATRRLIKDINDWFATNQLYYRSYRRSSDFINLFSRDRLRNFVRPERNYFRLAFRAIASDTNERTFIAALLPRDIGAQNSLWLSIPGRYVPNLAEKTIEFKEISLAKLLFAQAIFNSLTVDWILRASVAMNVNKTYVYRLPIPQPSDEELASNPVFAQIVRDSAILSYYKSPESLSALKSAFNITETEENLTLKLFETKKANLDIQIAKLYGLTSDNLLHILNYFKVLQRKNSAFTGTIKELAEHME